MTEAVTVSTTELCAAAGISYRQADYWSRLGLLRADPGWSRGGSGVPRRYPPEEVGVAACIARLIASGLALHPAAYVARKGPPPPAAERGHALAPGATLVVTAECWSVEEAPTTIPRQERDR